MDAVIFITIAIVYTISLLSKKEVVKKSDNIVKEDVTREAKLNSNFYEDPNAFMEIANALGFPKSGAV